MLCFVYVYNFKTIILHIMIKFSLWTIFNYQFFSKVYANLQRSSNFLCYFIRKMSYTINLFYSENWFCFISSYCIMILTLCITTVCTKFEAFTPSPFSEEPWAKYFRTSSLVRTRIFPFLYLNHFLVVRPFSDNVGLPWIFVFDSCRTQ